MIISHRHKFIFIKTEKTAGTSIEIALSKYCGPDDIITPIHPEDETMRQELGYRGAQNYKVRFKNYSSLDYLRLLRRRRRIRFLNHSGADYIMRHIDKEVWDSYFKFCFERNPWDKAISWYFWEYKKEPRPTLSEFIQSSEVSNLRGFDLYSARSEILVDKVYLYEELKSAMDDIGHRLKLNETPSLPHAKSGFRRDKRNYRELLMPADREKIARVFAREIAYFDYEW